MDATRRDLLKSVAVGGGAMLLLAENALAKGADKLTPEQKAAMDRDVAAVREKTKAEIIAKLDDKNLNVHALYELFSVKSDIRVKNVDSQTWHVKISKACGEGQDGYWEIPSGGTESWKRCIYHNVTVVLSEDRVSEEQSLVHTMMASSACNYYEINGGQLEYAGQPDNCL